MLSYQTAIKFSDYSELYDLIVPKDHLLRQINDLVDFSFILSELKDKYCSDNGRIAESPIKMFKYLLLVTTLVLSDSYPYFFLGLSDLRVNPVLYIRPVYAGK